IRYSTTRAFLAHSQFRKAAPTVAARVSDLLKSTWVASAAAITTPSTASTCPPGNPKPADCGKHLWQIATFGEREGEARHSQQLGAQITVHRNQRPDRNQRRSAIAHGD